MHCMTAKWIEAITIIFVMCRVNSFHLGGRHLNRRVANLEMKDSSKSPMSQRRELIKQQQLQKQKDAKDNISVQPKVYACYVNLSNFVYILFANLVTEGILFVQLII